MRNLIAKFPRPVTNAIIGMWRRRWLAIATAWGLAIAGWLALGTIPDMYRSQAQVYINTDTALDPTISEVGVRPNLEKGVRIIRTQLLSRDNLERVIYEAGLDGGITGPVSLQRRIDDLRGQVTIETEEEGYYVFSYMDTDPKKAQRVVATLLDLFIEQNLSTTSGGVRRAMDSLDQELALRERQLNEIDAEIATFRAANADELAGVDRLSRQLESREDELAGIEDRLALADARRHRLATRLAGTARYAPGSDLDALKLRLASLQSQFNDSYPDIQALKAQIAELESNSSSLPENREYREISATLLATEDEIASFQTRRRRLAADIAQLTRDAAQTPKVQSELDALLRRRTQVENTYVQLATEQSEMDVYQNLDRAGATVEYQRFEAPQVAAEADWPPRGLAVILILMASLGGGAGLAFALHYFDRSHTQTADLDEAYGLPVLGAISPVLRSGRAGMRQLANVGAGLAVVALLLASSTLYWWYEVSVGDDGSGALATLTETGTSL